MNAGYSLAEYKRRACRRRTGGCFCIRVARLARARLSRRCWLPKSTPPCFSTTPTFTRATNTRFANPKTRVFAATAASNAWTAITKSTIGSTARAGSKTSRSAARAARLASICDSKKPPLLRARAAFRSSAARSAFRAGKTWSKSIVAARARRRRPESNTGLSIGAKPGGSQRMHEIAKRENFYRQEYCGCVYSLRDSNRHRRETGRERIERGVSFYGRESAPTKD